MQSKTTRGHWGSWEEEEKKLILRDLWNQRTMVPKGNERGCSYVQVTSILGYLRVDKDTQQD